MNENFMKMKLDLIENAFGKKICEMLFSIHTIEVHIRVTYREREELVTNFVNIMEKHDKMYRGRERRILDINIHKLKEQGINRLFFFSQMNEVGIYGNYIGTVINLRTFLGYKTYPFLCIAHPNDLSDIPNQIRKFLDNYGIRIYMSQEMYYARIDYCCNIEFETEEELNLVLEILRKGRNSRYQKVIETNNEIRYQTNDYTLTFYRKVKQMQEKYQQYNACYKEEELLQADRVLRIEYRADRSNLYYLKEICNLEEDELIKQAPIIALYQFYRLYSYICGRGNFYKMKEAKSIIENSFYSQKIKDRMLHIVRVASRSNLKRVSLEMDNSKFRDCMDRFNELHLSPICIPTSYKIEKMNSLLWYVKNRNVNTR